MKNIYLDNAATTPLAPEVLEEMLPFLTNDFGNPSSSHSYGRKNKNSIELARKKIADFIGANSDEIVFTSGGTEADNMAIKCCVTDLDVQRIITSSIEHNAVVNSVEILNERYDIQADFVKLNEVAHVDLDHLETLLKSSNKKTLVSLMHANNELGNLLPIKEVSILCKKYGALFHSDTVQTMGHYKFDLKELDIDFITCAAHKFHGPKGVGFLYMNRKNKLGQFITGGSQERKHRGGTENVYGIIGLAKAMDLAFSDIDSHIKHVQTLKSYMISELLEIDSSIKFNGDVNEKTSLYTVLNVCFPKKKNASLLYFILDLNGVAASEGSACSAGAITQSHVLKALPDNQECQSIRFSFSRYTTKEEIDFALQKIRELICLDA